MPFTTFKNNLRPNLNPSHMHIKSKFLLTMALAAVVNTTLFAQEQKKVKRVDKNGNEIKVSSDSEKEDQLKKRFTDTPLGTDDFFELSFADFSKLLQTDFSTGKSMSYAGVNITKPTAEVSYAIRPKGILKKSFLNVGLSGGYGDDVISLIKGQKPAKNYSANVSYSIVLSTKYKYLGVDKYNLNSDYTNNYDLLFLTESQTTEINKLKTDKAALVKKLDSFYTFLNTNKNEVAKPKVKDSIYQNMMAYNKINNQLFKIDSVETKRNKLADSLIGKFKFNTKHLLWLTVSQKAGGSKFHYYDKLNPQNTTVNGKQTTNTYETTATINYFFKMLKPFGGYHIISNLLLTGGVSAGYFNNFDDLSSTEFKKVEKTDVTTTSYTNTDVTTVYDVSDFKTYHGAKVFMEGYKMFTASGSLGLRFKYLWDMPYGEPNDLTKRKSQQNIETGIVFNTAKKGSTREVSPISFEVFYSFNDVDGRNVSAANVGQKFYKRNQIGVKTAIPFNF